MVVPDPRGSNVHRLKQVVALVAVGLTVATTVVACGPAESSYAESTIGYTRSNLDPLFEHARQSELLGRPASDSPTLRHRSLVAIRSEGNRGAEAADLITDTFPTDTRGIPVYVERAEFDGAPALMILELTGPSGGQLDDVRLWVIDASGTIAYSEVR